MGRRSPARWSTITAGFYAALGAELLGQQAFLAVYVSSARRKSPARRLRSSAGPGPGPTSSVYASKPYRPLSRPRSLLVVRRPAPWRLLLLWLMATTRPRVGFRALGGRATHLAGPTSGKRRFGREHPAIPVPGIEVGASFCPSGCPSLRWRSLEARWRAGRCARTSSCQCHGLV